ncbi:hypothetical protein N8590_02975, partial [bacterium]|nr:hypothetical protein [bacterium]
MSEHTEHQDDEFLKVMLGRSELHLVNIAPEVFYEGPQSADAIARYAKIRSCLENDFLENLITEIKGNPTGVSEIPQEIVRELEELVDSISSEKGRGLVGLTLMQLCIKAICVEQSIRLHKGASHNSGDGFSWCEGISMRVLDKNFFTPVLRNHGLISLNKDGIMMTRSLAENYPYSKFYKAALRGAKSQWLNLTDLIETEQVDPLAALKVLVALLLNRRQAF